MSAVSVLSFVQTDSSVRNASSLRVGIAYSVSCMLFHSHITLSRIEQKLSSQCGQFQVVSTLGSPPWKAYKVVHSKPLGKMACLRVLGSSRFAVHLNLSAFWANVSIFQSKWKKLECYLAVKIQYCWWGFFSHPCAKGGAPVCRLPHFLTALLMMTFGGFLAFVISYLLGYSRVPDSFFFI